jgi:uncharacterized iron-regulated membrane protein
MIGEPAHIQFIVWAYTGVAALIGLLIGFVIWGARRVKAKLEALEKAGIRRRSAGGDT